MRVGIDARPLTRQRTGVGNYIYELVHLLPALVPQNSYFLYSNREIDPSLSANTFQRRTDRSFHFCPGSFWLRGRVGGFLRQDQIDIFWSVFPILPPRLPASILKIITVHDLVWLRFPETVAAYNLCINRLWAEKAIRDADRVVVNSRSTGDELVDFLGVPAEKIRVVYPVLSNRFGPQVQQTAADYISSKYGVPPRYFAAVGTVEPRKNLKLLVEVQRILKSKGQVICPLLVVGSKGWKNSQLFRDIQMAGLTDRDIRFLGYLPDEDLPVFYGGAQLFLFPSLYEGFGLPPLEAMACGTPVIASDAPCMPEVLGNAAILESCANAERFAEAIAYVSSNTSVREEMRAKGIRWSQRFQGECSTKQLLSVFGEDRPDRLNTCPSSVSA